jgi:hypothetical protein
MLFTKSIFWGLRPFKTFGLKKGVKELKKIEINIYTVYTSNIFVMSSQKDIKVKKSKKDNEKIIKAPSGDTRKKTTKKSKTIIEEEVKTQVETETQPETEIQAEKELQLEKEQINESKELDDIGVIPEQKKRGRRPKQKSEEEILKQSSLSSTNNAPTVQPVKKKGKNPKESYGLNEEFEEDDPFFNQQEPEKECLETPIMRLNVSTNDIKKIKDPNFNIADGDNDLNIPSAFNGVDGFSYFQVNGSNNKEQQQQSGTAITEEDLQKLRNNREKELENVDSNNESKLLNQYIEHNKKGTWPEKSVYDCMWCRFPFDNAPWAVPFRVNSNGKYEVFGNFCSPNCVAAYIFDSFDDDEMWDKYALLNQLYQRVYNIQGSIVKVAPNVLFLKKLGGILSIEEYREISLNNNKNFFLKMPPMISIIPSVEELQQTSLFNENNNREHLNKELMMKANDELRLRRNKPIYDDTNTLDNYFHISKK